MTASTPAHDVRTLDCLGKACPVPVIELAKAMAQLDAGDEIVVVADDPGAKVDIPVWCRMKSQQLVGVAESDGTFEFRVRKTA